MGELARFKSHKIVTAGKILPLDFFRSTMGLVVTVEDAYGAPLQVEMPLNAFSRGQPNPGDYIVIYDDGYKSWSPARAFEEGYTRTTE